MGWLGGVFVYVLIWWVVLFAVLPWGVRVPDRPEPGHATSAPSNPRLGPKLLVTSAIAALLWLAAYFVIDSNLIDVGAA